MTLASKCELGCKFATHFCYDQDSEVSETLATPVVMGNIRLSSLEGVASLNVTRTQSWMFWSLLAV